jgi:hypothetical protein
MTTPDLTEFSDGELRFMLATALSEIDKLRAKLTEKKLVIMDHELADYKGEVAELKAKLAELQPADKYSPAPVFTSNCSRHPDAPHGFDRTASRCADEYVCTCQSWQSGDAS